MTYNPIKIDFMPEFTMDTRVAILGSTLQEAVGLFDKINIYKTNYFTKDTKHYKVTRNGVRYMLSGIKNHASCLKGCSIHFVITPDDLNPLENEQFYTCIYPVLASMTQGKYNPFLTVRKIVWDYDTIMAREG